jgi:exopolysaccharide biosynthesis protein
MGTALCLTQDCTPMITTVERHKHIDWSNFNTVICCGPRLVANGSISLNPASEGFQDQRVLGNSNRTGVGITSSNKLLLVNTSKSVSLAKWAEVMKALGCVDAVNFDGGASSAMYYRGKTISTPGRKLTNVLLVYER